LDKLRYLTELMKKTYILDTCVLVHHPEAFLSFPEALVVIPVTVLDELDKLKSKPDQTGRNARHACKLLEKHVENISDNLLENKSYLRIDVCDYYKSIIVGDPLYGDNRILATAIYYHNKCKESDEFEAVFVTRDINARVRAKAFGVKSISYEKDDVKTTAPFSGVMHMHDDEMLSDFFDGNFDPDNYDDFPELFPNEFLVLHDETETGLAILKNENGELKEVKKTYPWDLSPKNPEQVCAIDLIMDPKISLVTILGSAGGGKSLISIAACLELVLHQSVYDKFIVYRPMSPVGEEMGFLPGSMEEKLQPWMQPIYDSVEVLFKSNKPTKRQRSEKDSWKQDFAMFIEQGKIELNALTYIRGRSLPKSIILIDEAQNITKENIKTILTRAGEGSKIILTGDIEQIDNKNLDQTNNGLSYVLEKFKNYDLAGHVTLVKGERSELATLAAEIL